MSDEMNQEQVQQLLDQAMAVNLDEVVSDSITVAVRVYEPVTENGKTRRVASSRTASLDTFVPMKIFNKMIASRQKAVRDREKFLKSGGEKGDESDPMVEWMSLQVLNVWKLSEPDMTMDELLEGLNYLKIQKLFTLFFGDVIRTKENKV